MRSAGIGWPVPPLIVSRRIGASLWADQTYWVLDRRRRGALPAVRSAGLDHLRAGVEVVIRSPGRLPLDQAVLTVVVVVHCGRGIADLDQPVPGIVGVVCHILRDAVHEVGRVLDFPAQAVIKGGTPKMDRG